MSMKRREFIKKAGIATGAALTMPYLLPTGRLFAQTGSEKAKHVVFVLFAGGVRQQEAVLQRYLAESQDLPIEGNIMYNMLTGAPPELKIVYGTTSPGGQPGGQPISPILQTPLDKQGTLFPEIRFSKAGTGHFVGLSTGVSGYYGTTQGLRQRPIRPTIFEHVRRFTGAKATDVWFVGNGIGNSTPLLNHSEYPGFGARYAANFFAPNITFGNRGLEFLKGFKVYHPEEELLPVREMQAFLNNGFNLEGKEIPHLYNTEEEKFSIKEFIRTTFERLENNQVAFPPVTDNGDLTTIGYATEILRWFKPKLMVINMSAVDSCHGSYTSYLKSLHRGDHGVAHLWNYIQNNIPEMSGNTIMIVMPEHGRNLNPNPITDENDWFAFDHDSDANSRRIFTMMVGPNVPANLRVGSEANPVGDAADSAMTIADILGIKQDVLGTGLMDFGARSLFDRI
ncbi:MAG: hypothetical protein J5I41_06620 [Saprospiraceae bacterium]|nr:hypothetical protein [Saprospiraceae bacterium]